MRKLMLIALVAATVLAPVHAQAFDGARKGFVLGLGLGFGSAKQTISAQGVSLSNTEGGLATTFKIGAGLSDNFVLYYSNRVVFFNADVTVGLTNSSHSLNQGMSAVAGSYYLEPAGPSFFFTGELGVGILTDRDADASDSGFGVGLGVGYDFGNHFVLEGTFMHAKVGAEDVGDVTIDESITNLAVTASWFGF
jgi:hypothetical protein